MGTRLRKSCIDESRSSCFPSSRSEQTTQTAAALKLNHLDIHDDDDAGSQGAVVKKKKRGQQRDARKNKSRRGLPQISMKVLEKVESKGRTTFNEVADELVAELADPMNSGLSPNKQQYDEKNVRRRAYDVLNVLMAMDIISKDKKEIQWKGLPPSAIEELKIERLGIRNRIESKASYLKELEEQVSPFHSLIDLIRG
ncbi:putative transcription factor E2F-DP family [Medicago truncatula]|uniref:Putative transcription factor E2F-DP family n=1 Tax=Medicago truncatula TaxID=3880 RepID=A0A396HCH8_MEDTR|nr:putative transcription factor E2F-DP family [Medicago truncatula]